jgi:hypothetical protein
MIHDIDSDNDEEFQCAIHVLERRRNMCSEYDIKVDSMSMGVGHLNNNQVVVCLTD